MTGHRLGDVRAGSTGAVAVENAERLRSRRGLDRHRVPAGGQPGVRPGGPDLVAAVEPGLTPQLAYPALLPDEHLVITSDSADYTARAVSIVEDDAASLHDAEPVAAMSAALGESSVASVVTVGRRACIASGFAGAAPGDRALARQRIDAVEGSAR